MTIDEAIEHAKEVARTCDDGQCAADHIQLAEWLRQARGADKAARWYTEEIQELRRENASLRYMVYVYKACHDRIDACRGCEELPECDALRQLRELGREVGIEVG